MNEAPEVYVACEVCGGEGQTEHSRYGGNDPDVWAVPCQACNGLGGMICEAEGERIRDEASRPDQYKTTQNDSHIAMWRSYIYFQTGEHV